MTNDADTSDAIRLFRETWGLYQRIVKANYMFHRELSASVREMLRTLPGTPLTILDLGSGDAEQISSILRGIPIAEYCGCDLSSFALDIARRNMSWLGDCASLLCEDMLSLVRRVPEGHYDVVYSSFALHHLSAEDKLEFFKGCRHALKPNGWLVLVDDMREEGESRQESIDRYCADAALLWTGIASADLAAVEEHIRAFDFPETASLLKSMANTAGLPRAELLRKHTRHQAWRYFAS